MSTGDRDAGVSEHREVDNPFEEINSKPRVSNQYRVVHVKGDGRCLFQSIIVEMYLSLQTVERNENGKPLDPMLDVYVHKVSLMNYERKWFHICVLISATTQIFKAMLLMPICHHEYDLHRYRSV